MVVGHLAGADKEKFVTWNPAQGSVISYLSGKTFPWVSCYHMSPSGRSFDLDGLPAQVPGYPLVFVVVLFELRNNVSASKSRHQRAAFSRRLCCCHVWVLFDGSAVNNLVRALLLIVRPSWQHTQHQLNFWKTIPERHLTWRQEVLLSLRHTCLGPCVFLSPPSVLGIRCN